MRPFLFTERNGIHIIDLQQTMTQLDTAFQQTRSVVSSGGTVLFVGTKRQAQQSIEDAASQASMPYVNNRWLGGTLTNFRTIRQRVDFMIKLEQQDERGDFDRLSKKEALVQHRLIDKLQRRLGGLREMRRLPDLVFITDVNREDIAVKECNKLGIPIIAMVDTNCDPDPVDLVIPANDDAIRAIKLISGVIASAVQEGQQMREVIEAEEEEDYKAAMAEEIVEPESLLGASTLAKIASGIVEMDEKAAPVQEEVVEEVEVAEDEEEPAEPEAEVEADTEQEAETVTED
jgi:small subunit ribosomal protein S2